MRSITYALLACLASAAVLAGCTSTPNEASDRTDQLDTNITVTTPNCGTAAEENADNMSEGANNTASEGTGEGACEDGTTEDVDNSTTETNETNMTTNETNSTGGV
jgi:hypothetical protein